MLNRVSQYTAVFFTTLLKSHLPTDKHCLFLGLFSGRNYLLLILLCFTIFTDNSLGQMTVEDKDSNILMEVSDEGTVGSIVLPETIAAPLSTLNKLYNLSGTLNWNGSQLTLGGTSSWVVSGNNMYSNLTGNVGIGTSTPNAGLHVRSNEGVLFGGTLDSGTALNLGTGIRMMWYPKKAAFRAGYVDGSEWDDINIGLYSTAMGGYTKASGSYSTAIGWSTTASNNSSTAMGASTKASGSYSTAMGLSTIASGWYSTAMGYTTKAESYNSTVIGTYNVGGGTASSWVGTDPLFEIGIGADDSHRANAMTVLKNGNVGIGLVAPDEKLDVDKGNILVRGINGFLINGDAGILYLGSIHHYIKGEHGFGVKIGTYAVGDAISIKEISGNVGIGTTAPSRKLWVNGDAGGTTGWYNDSDARLKKNITTINSPLKKVSKLRGVNFEWKDKTNHSDGIQMGFIAQEAKEIIPELVEKKGEYYSMQYAPITALLVEAVKEQNSKFRKQNEEFRIQNADLSKRIEKLEKVINTLAAQEGRVKLTSVEK